MPHPPPPARQPRTGRFDPTASGALAGLRGQLTRTITIPAAVAVSAVVIDPVWSASVGLPGWVATTCSVCVVAGSFLATRWRAGCLVSLFHQRTVQLAEEHQAAAQASAQQARQELAGQRKNQAAYQDELGQWAQAVVAEMEALRAALTDTPSSGSSEQPSAFDGGGDPLQAVHAAVQLLGTAVGQAQSLATARGEQAALLTLGRRSEAVLAKVIEGFDTAEKHTDDPEQLARLWRLDGQVTRAVRFARSAAVLGGARGHRNLKPMPLSTVLTHAVAEVTNYEQVRVPPDVQHVLPGNAAYDLVHITAELLENATAFSPPGTPVEVHVSTVNTGVAIEIDDRGIGFGRAERERWNRLLAEPDARQRSESLKEWRIGLCVVAELAARRGLRVELQENVFGSTRAVVIVPQHLLHTEEPETLQDQEHSDSDSATSGSALCEEDMALPHTLQGGTESLPVAAEDPCRAALPAPHSAPAEPPAPAATASGLPTRRRGTSYMAPELRGAAVPGGDDAPPPQASNPGAAVRAAQRGWCSSQREIDSSTPHSSQGERS
ncbi:ATP-binding protein [Streptomyces sp. NPDC053474]|uniref:ATP-binding protein n=1 Tax=Streptomyces sp. NPDC053474 TaxID=3365704 RepID=UPI0037CECCD8